jgi:hypothetical protein
VKKTINRIISMVVAVALTLGVFFSASASSASVPQMAGITYYVAVTGSDLNTCTQAAPCKSFNKAMSLAQAGDVISVMPGTYNQSLVISKSGITVAGNGAVIDTTGTFGIRVASTAQNVVVRGFTVTRTNSHAIYVEGQFVTIENNVVYHSVLENGTLLNGVLSCGNGSWGSAIKVKVGGENVIIRNNEVFDNCGEGIAATRSVNVLIEGNRVYDNHSVNIYVDNSINTQVLNNHSFCANRDTSPIAVGEEYYDGWGAQLRDVVIKDNRIEGCQRAIIVYGSGVGGTLTNVLIDNNIVASGTGTKSVISLDNQSNSNVRITNNQLWKLNIWVRSPSGVTLSNNALYSAAEVTVTAKFRPPTQAPTAVPMIESRNISRTTISNRPCMMTFRMRMSNARTLARNVSGMKMPSTPPNSAPNNMPVYAPVLTPPVVPAVRTVRAPVSDPVTPPRMIPVMMPNCTPFQLALKAPVPTPRIAPKKTPNHAPKILLFE